MTSSAPGDDVTLDDVVARVRELPTTLRSLYVETDGWTDRARSHDASSRREGLLAPSTPVDPSAQRTRHHVRSWMVFDREHWDQPLIGVTPARCRVEVEYTHTDGEVDVSVTGLDATAQWSGRGGEVERHDPRGVGSIHSAWVVNRHWIGDRVGRELMTEVVEVLGRRCVRFRVTPPPGHWAPAPLHSGDEHHLDVDPETGLTLALTSWFEGEPISHHEVLALDLDPEVDPALTAPPDDAVPAAAPKHYVSAEEVAADARDLTVFAPTWLPDDYVFDTGHAGLDQKGTARATLIYTVERRRFVTFIEFPDPARERKEVDGWTVVDRGERWVAISDVTEAEGVRISRASIDGTGILIRARLSADELLDVAFSLEPVRV